MIGPQAIGDAAVGLCLPNHDRRDQFAVRKCSLNFERDMSAVVDLWRYEQNDPFRALNCLNQLLGEGHTRNFITRRIPAAKVETLKRHGEVRSVTSAVARSVAYEQ